MSIKAAFFDIDGTLWDYDCVLPESTVKAVQAFRANGNKAYLCTGRTKGHAMSPKLWQMGFDGLVAGCGTYAEDNGEIVYNHIIDDNLALKTVETCYKYKCYPMLEGTDCLYFSFDDFAQDEYGRKIMAEKDHVNYDLYDTWGEWKMNKLACASKEGSDRDKVIEELGDYYDFLIHNDFVFEMVPKGHTKASGMKLIIERLGINMDDTYAFGDSVNDINMLEASGVGVAMGNASEIAKNAADYVTTDIHDDGIYNALKHFELI
ncbi:MAG: Cof-type HAD-IIB family hydrolase [Lachnospiraceae bacterium]|nr:Cof-type HAD-IIB family hydrolase [Lachnospiraceae bacterium]